MSEHKAKYVSVQAIFQRASSKAVLIISEQGEKVWVARSTLSWQCDKALENLDEDEDFELELFDWAARAKDLI